MVPGCVCHSVPVILERSERGVLAARNGVQKDGSLVSNAEGMSGHTHIRPVYAVPPSQSLQTLGFLHFKPSQMPSQSRPKPPQAVPNRPALSWVVSSV